jgi:hypothetical protein
VYESTTRTAFTTAAASATITNTYQGGDTTVSLAGQPFDCSNWTEDAGASIAAPNLNMDVDVPVLGITDIAQALRLNDD